MNIYVSFTVPHKGLVLIIDENGIVYDGDGIVYDENGIVYDGDGIVYDGNGKAEPIAVTKWLDHTFKDAKHLYNWLSKESKSDYKPRCTRKVSEGQFRDIVDLNRITKQQQHTIVLTNKHKLSYGVRYIFTVSKA
jgi:hypothetical protein